MTCDAEWPQLDRMAARQIEDPMLRFGAGTRRAARPDGQHAGAGLRPDAGCRLGLKNVDRVMAMLIPATTQRGQDYTKLAEMYQALLVKRNNELAAVASWSAGWKKPAIRAGEARRRLRRCPRNGNGRR